MALRGIGRRRYTHACARTVGYGACLHEPHTGLSKPHINQKDYRPVMRVVFMGTPELAVPSLAAVAAHHEVAAVVCQPDKPQGRGRKPAPPAVRVWAEAQNLPVHQPAKLNDGAFETWLRALAPDVGVVAAYGRILKPPILAIPPHGYINMHPSLLPRWRGPSPIRTALLHGDSVTGVSIMRLDEGMDSGDLLLVREVPVRDADNAVTLADQLGALGGEMLVEALDLIARGNARFTPQDHAQATYSQMFTKEDGRIRWGKPAREIHNLVRAAVPWPVAHCLFRNAVYRIHASTILEESTGATPGTVVEVNRDTLSVATGDGLLVIRTIQAPGKRAMPVGDFLRGHPVEPGERFEDIVDHAG